MRTDISIDPGTTHTGVCIWNDGRPVVTITLSPPKQCIEYLDKLLWLKQKLEKVFEENGPITRIAVEKFQPFTQRPNMLAMMKCSATRGMILGIADNWCETVMEASKRTIKKGETAILAKDRGVTGSKDAMDAYQIGICAGFDRK